MMKRVLFLAVLTVAPLALAQVTLTQEAQAKLDPECADQIVDEVSKNLEWAIPEESWPTFGDVSLGLFSREHLLDRLRVINSSNLRWSQVLGQFIDQAYSTESSWVIKSTPNPYSKFGDIHFLLAVLTPEQTELFYGPDFNKLTDFPLPHRIALAGSARNVIGKSEFETLKNEIGESGVEQVVANIRKASQGAVALTVGTLPEKGPLLGNWIALHSFSLVKQWEEIDLGFFLLSWLETNSNRKRQGLSTDPLFEYVTDLGGYYVLDDSFLVTLSYGSTLWVPGLVLDHILKSSPNEAATIFKDIAHSEKNQNFISALQYMTPSGEDWQKTHIFLDGKEVEPDHLREVGGMLRLKMTQFLHQAKVEENIIRSLRK